MADIKIEVGHTLDQCVAIERIHGILSSGSNAMLADVDFTHQDDRFSFSGKVKGFKVSGKMAVLDDSVRMIVDLPWAAKPFRKTADDYIRDYLKKTLA